MSNLVLRDLDYLKSRYAQVMEFMIPRTRLSDGSLGYSMSARTEMTIHGGPNPSSEDAPVETITFDIERCEVIVPDPVFTADGGLRFDIEILAIEGRTVSHVLFGEDTEVLMKVGRGVDPFLRPTFGRTEIALDQDISNGVSSSQFVNLEIETKYGRLRNRQPAHMLSTITQLPPLHAPYVQQGVVELFNDRGIVNAAKAASMSVLTDVDG
ncbi:hypothetical protein ACQP1U_18410 [Actinomycetota bacterium]